jgi:hypothetical protein
MTMILAIVSMVYGSYFAASKSADVCGTRIAVSGQMRKALEQMARQIRCAYAGTNVASQDSSNAIVKQKQSIFERDTTQFGGNSKDRTGEILHLVTTSGFLSGKKTIGGLFATDYRLDGNTHRLFLRQRRFGGTTESAEKEGNWQLIAESIKCVELAFFDGEKWLQSWDFADKKKVPFAVKVNIVGEDENHRQYNYGTVAHICSRNYEDGERIAEVSASVKKQ